MRRSSRTLLCTIGAVSALLPGCANGSRTEQGVPYTNAGAARPADQDASPQANVALDGDVANSPGAAEPATRCVFQKADRPLSVAFCETFDQPAPVVTRSGTMDQVLWGASRLNTFVNPSQGQLNDYHPTRLIGCGTGEVVNAPNDVQVCGGRLYESANDMSGQTTVAIYPKQPFDYTGRTGTVVFDVSLNSEGPHAAWPEFWITDKPIPAPSDGRAANFAWARHQFGISFGEACKRGYTGVDRISVVRNYRVENIPFVKELPWSEDHGQCFRTSSATGALNHVEIRMSPAHAEVWVTEPGSDTLKLVASVKVDMPLTKGLIWLVDAHYNANKFDTQGDHTFSWDNIGFDGPKTYRDLGFDVPDANTPARAAGARQLGYELGQKPVAFRITGVQHVQPPTGALAVFNYFVCDNNIVPSVRINGGPWHDTASPYESKCGWRAMDVAIPMAEVRNGANTLEFRAATGWAVLSNISLILVAGAPVP